MTQTYVIAEAGVNHNGDLAMARQLIDVAAEAGADAVKFQAFHPELVVAGSGAKAEYQKLTTGAGQSQLDMLRGLALDGAMHQELAGYCRTRGIIFLSSPFDIPSVDMLVALGLPLLKIPSGEITNLPLLRRIASSGLPVILSTGMSEMPEIAAALEALEQAGTPPDGITLLHCNTEYPTPFEDVNLRAMTTLRESFRVPVGYSDHTPGIEIALAAVALGATVIEKHFTLDRTLRGPDHKASLEPAELRALVSGIRHIEVALGSGDKRPSPSERRNIMPVRRSLVALMPILAGERFTPENVAAKRPAGGISPMRWDEVMGRTARRDFAADELIEL